MQIPQPDPALAFTPEQFKQHVSRYDFLTCSIEKQFNKARAYSPVIDSTQGPAGWHKEYMANPAAYKQTLETIMAYTGTDPKKSVEAGYAAFTLSLIFLEEVVAQMSLPERIELSKYYLERSQSDPIESISKSLELISLGDPSPSSDQSLSVGTLEQFLGTEQTDRNGERFTVINVECVKDPKGYKRNMYTVLYPNRDMRYTVEADILAAMIGYY